MREGGGVPRGRQQLYNSSYSRLLSNMDALDLTQQRSCKMTAETFLLVSFFFVMGKGDLQLIGEVDLDRDCHRRSDVIAASES